MLYNCAKLNPQVDKFKITRTKHKESGVDFSIAAIFLFPKRAHGSIDLGIPIKHNIPVEIGGRQLLQIRFSFLPSA